MLRRLLEGLQNQWKGVLYGLALGVAGNWVFSQISTTLSDRAYQKEAYAELLERLHGGQQAILYISPLDPEAVFQRVRSMYQDTQSRTGNPKFEGKRIENLLYDLRALTGDEATRALLDHVKYIENDIPFWVAREGDEGVKKSIRKINDKLTDYTCCMSFVSGHDMIGCRVEEFHDGPKYCLYMNKLIIAP